MQLFTIQKSLLSLNGLELKMKVIFNHKTNVFVYKMLELDVVMIPQLFFLWSLLKLLHRERVVRN